MAWAAERGAGCIYSVVSWWKRIGCVIFVAIGCLEMHVSVCLSSCAGMSPVDFNACIIIT